MMVVEGLESGTTPDNARDAWECVDAGGELVAASSVAALDSAVEVPRSQSQDGNRQEFCGTDPLELGGEIGSAIDPNRLLDRSAGRKRDEERAVLHDLAELRESDLAPFADGERAHLGGDHSHRPPEIKHRNRPNADSRLLLACELIGHGSAPPGNRVASSRCDDAWGFPVEAARHRPTASEIPPHHSSVRLDPALIEGVPMRIRITTPSASLGTTMESSITGVVKTELENPPVTTGSTVSSIHPGTPARRATTENGQVIVCMRDASQTRNATIIISWCRKVRNFLESVGLPQFMLSGADATPDCIANKVAEAAAHSIEERDPTRVMTEARDGVRVLAATIRSLPAMPQRQTAVRWVINGRFLAQPVTGVQRYGREIVRELSLLSRETAQNVQLEIIGPQESVAIDNLDGIPFEATDSGHGHIWVQTALLRAAKGKPILSLTANGPLFARRQILCIHDVNVFLVPTSYSLPYRFLHRILLPILAKKAERVVTVSNYSASMIAARGLCPAERNVVIPNGHEHVFEWDASRASPAILALLSRPFVFMLGSRARHKNTHVVLRCAQDLAHQGIDIVVAGGQASCFATVEGSLDRSNVMELGRVTDDDLAALFQRALCFAFPSTMEGFGLPVLEAMALGCPVIASDAASLPEVGGDAVLYADPRNPAAWLAHIRLLASDSALRAGLRDRGRDRANLFSWKESARKYLELLEDASGGALPPRPRIAVGIATSGRPEILAETLAEIGRQTRPADRIVICPATPADCPATGNLPVVADIVRGHRGLTAQRNVILEAAREADILVFFDDDFFPDPTYLAEIEQVMLSDPTIAMVTGNVLADGILGPGLSPIEARAILHAAPPLPVEKLAPAYNGYGCNMAVRMDRVRSRALRFDENLPLYGWLEDVDFSRRLARNGRITKSLRARGVHLGSKSGRTPGLRLGYSQVANPYYLMRAGTMRFDKAILQILRNIAQNTRKLRRPEPWIDRAGRLDGNFIALRELFLGQLYPGKILHLPDGPPPQLRGLK